jgi:hypothetical protein
MKFKRMVNNKLRGAYAEIDEKKKTIAINKKRHKQNVKRYDKNKDGSEKLINTIVHEELHAKHPKMHEKTVYKKAKQNVKIMSKKVKGKYYSKFK